MAPAVLASFPTFPVLAVSNSYDPINVQSRQDSHFYIDDKEYENCLPRSPTGRSTRSSPSTNFSSCASRLTRRISGGSASTCSSLSSKTGGLTRRARNFVGNLVGCPSAPPSPQRLHNRLTCFQTVPLKTLGTRVETRRGRNSSSQTITRNQSRTHQRHPIFIKNGRRLHLFRQDTLHHNVLEEIELLRTKDEHKSVLRAHR